MSANTICWKDIPVVNLDRAIKFYSAVLGVKVKKESFSGFKMSLLPHESQNVLRCLCKLKGNKPSKTGPLIYLSVGARHDKAEKAAAKKGGKVLQKKHMIGPYGFRSVILDSEGNRIALHSEKG